MCWLVPTCPPFTRESVSILLKQQHPIETNLAYDWYEWFLFLNGRCCKVNTFSTAFCWLTDLNRLHILCFICWPKYKLWVHLCSLSLVFHLLDLKYVSSLLVAYIKNIIMGYFECLEILNSLSLCYYLIVIFVLVFETHWKKYFTVIS